MKTRYRILLGFSLATSIVTASADSFSRQLLLKKPLTLSTTQLETQVFKVHFPQGFKTPLHTHPGPGPRYVIKGELKVNDNGESKIYKTGEVFWESGAEMTVENVGASDAEMVIFELSPANNHH